MFDLLDKIQKGFTYHDVTDGKTVPMSTLWKTVPMSTLWTRVKGMYEGKIRPKLGAPSLFPLKLEADLALYLKHCDLLRIPRTCLEFKQDIMHYVNFHDLSFKRLQDDRPGRTWCDRFSEEWKELVDFPSKGVSFRIRNDPISMKLWVKERDKYTRIQKQSKLFPNKMYILVLEANELEVVAENKMLINIVMIYNAEGQLLRPVVAHAGDIPKAIQQYYGNEMIFCETADGQLDQTLLVEVCQYIQRDFAEREMFESPVIYFCPGVSQCIGYTLWDLCNRYQFIMQTVPQNIYNYFRTGNMGIFEKVKPAFKQVVVKKFPDARGYCMYFDFLQMVKDVISSLKLTTHLRNSCRRLRIVALERVPEAEQETQMQEEVIDDTEQEEEQDVPVQEEIFENSEIQNLIRSSVVDNLPEDDLPDLE